MRLRSSLSALALLVSGMMATSALAGTVTLTLDESVDGQFKLYADDSTGDNGGIASYGVVLGNVTNITSLDHNSPNALAAQNSVTSAFGAAGFTSLRSADQIPTLLASQDTITPTPNIIYGFGQTASSFAALNLTPFGPNESPTWNAHLLLASGTYTGTFKAGNAPTMSGGTIDTFANIFTASSGTAVSGATLNLVTIGTVPEPASLALIGLALVGGLGLRRRK